MTDAGFITTIGDASAVLYRAMVHLTRSHGDHGSEGN